MHNLKKLLLIGTILVYCAQTHTCVGHFTDRLIANAVFIGVNAVLYFYIQDTPQNPVVAIKRLPRFTKEEHAK